MSSNVHFRSERLLWLSCGVKNEGESVFVCPMLCSTVFFSSFNPLFILALSSQYLSNFAKRTHVHSKSLSLVVSHTAGHRVDCQLCSIIVLLALAAVLVCVVQTCSQLRELVHRPVRAALFPFN